MAIQLLAQSILPVAVQFVLSRLWPLRFAVWPDTQVSGLRRGEERAVPILVPAAGVGVLSGKSKAVPEFKWKTRNLSGLVFSCIEAKFCK